MDCIFCKIIKGDIPCQKVYEDERVFVFLDIKPVNPGHCLVIPKVHSENFFEMDDQTYTHLFGVVKGLSQEIDSKFKPQRVGLMVQGFDVAHAHVHVIPLMASNDITTKRALEGRSDEIESTQALNEALKILTE